MAIERTPITPSDEFGPVTIVKRGQSAEIAVWRSRYNGANQISLAQRHPQKTAGFWKAGVANLDGELSAAVAEASVGWTIGVEAPAVEAPKAKAKRGVRKA